MEPEPSETPQEATQPLPTDPTNENADLDLRQLIAEADRAYEGAEEVTNQTETETNSEPTKYSRAITKIQRFDTKLRVLSMRDKVLRKHSKAVKALLETGKLQEAEDLALLVPGNEKLDEECTDGIFHQTEVSEQTNKQIHFPPIHTKNHLVGVGPDTFLSQEDTHRLEELLGEETHDSLVTEESNGMLEIDINLDLIAGAPEDEPLEAVPSVPSDLEAILSREEMQNPFSSSEDLNLKRIDTALELLATESVHDNLTVSPSVEALLSQINAKN